MYWFAMVIFIAIASLLGAIVVERKHPGFFASVKNSESVKFVKAVWLKVVCVVAIIAIGFWLYGHREAIWDFVVKTKSLSFQDISSVMWEWMLWVVVLGIIGSVIAHHLTRGHGRFYHTAIWGSISFFALAVPMWTWISSAASSTDEIEWVGDLTIPPNGKSELVPKDPGTYVVMSADDEFVNHTVYADGTECAYNGTQCPDGIVSGNYAENKTSKTIIVSYGYAK